MPLDATLAVALARASGLVLLAAAIAAVVAVVHRWYARTLVPEGLAVLAGLGAVALYLNTAGALGAVIGGDIDLLGSTAAMFNVGTFLVGALAAGTAARLGDRAGRALFEGGGRAVEMDVTRFVRSAGRALTVELPDGVEDIEGYDPVDETTREQLAGETLVFPRRLTVAELRERLTERLKDDYGVGHVDLDLAEDGTVEYLAVGSRAAGLGPTLPPGSAAVAVHADPAFAASAGDLVQVWRTDAESPERVASGEVRGMAGDVVTVAVDAVDAETLEPDVEYRLSTLPVEPRADREFVSLLRAAEETMGVTTVAAGSTLDGAPVGALDVAVVAIRGTDGGIEPLPSRSRTVGPDETLYVIGRPEGLRRLDEAARPAGTDND